MELPNNEPRALFEDGLIHRTQRGDLVRSKSEVAIADALHARGIRYQYEAAIAGPDGSERYPDFTIRDDDAGVTWIWEHLGMLHDPGYRARWAAKVKWYRAGGILAWNDPDVGEVRLIETRDGENGGLDMEAIGRLIDEVLRGEGGPV